MDGFNSILDTFEEVSALDNNLNNWWIKFCKRYKVIFLLFLKIFEGKVITKFSNWGYQDTFIFFTKNSKRKKTQIQPSNKPKTF